MVLSMFLERFPEGAFSMASYRILRRSKGTLGPLSGRLSLAGWAWILLRFPCFACIVHSMFSGPLSSRPKLPPKLPFHPRPLHGFACCLGVRRFQFWAVCVRRFRPRSFCAFAFSNPAVWKCFQPSVRELFVPILWLPRRCVFDGFLQDFEAFKGYVRPPVGPSVFGWLGLNPAGVSLFRMHHPLHVLGALKFKAAGLCMFLERFPEGAFSMASYRILRRSKGTLGLCRAVCLWLVGLESCWGFLVSHASSTPWLAFHALVGVRAQSARGHGREGAKSFLKPQKAYPSQNALHTISGPRKVLVRLEHFSL